MDYAMQNMFEVRTKQPITDQTLLHLYNTILSQVTLSWLDMVLSDPYTVNIILETTQDVDDVSHTIATLIQTH